jgi:CheY-like chemotaxis protein
MKILLVEDQPNDVLLARRAFAKVLPGVAMEVASDGEEAIAMLAREEGGDRPNHVLLDLKLPRKSGLEVLAWLRARPDTRSVRVIVLTSSSEARDIERAGALGIDRYCVKPLLSQDFLELVRSIGATWGLPGA